MCFGNVKVVVHVNAVLGVGNDASFMDSKAGLCCGNLGSDKVGAALDATIVSQGHSGTVSDAADIELGGPLYANISDRWTWK